MHLIFSVHTPWRDDILEICWFSGPALAFQSDKPGLLALSSGLSGPRPKLSHHEVQPYPLICDAPDCSLPRLSRSAMFLHFSVLLFLQAATTRSAPPVRVHSPYLTTQYIFDTKQPQYADNSSVRRRGQFEANLLITCRL